MIRRQNVFFNVLSFQRNMQMFSWDLLWHSDSIVLGISCIVLAFENKKVLCWSKFAISCFLPKAWHSPAKRKFRARKRKRLHNEVTCECF